MRLSSTGLPDAYGRGRIIGDFRRVALYGIDYLKEQKLNEWNNKYLGDMIDAIGKVVKGARRSQSHQTSRALSFEKGVQATILPELLIDENDVNASHAMSIGRVDDDQLYYLMSRGLSVKQCTSLISTGYLMPITDTLNNEVLKEKLKEEMERKLNELC